MTSSYEIVVGVDGSDASKSALRWAVDEARARDGRVTAVLAWHVPVDYAMYEGMPIPESAEVALEKASDRALRDAVEVVVGEDTSVPVVASLRNGSPSKVLVDASREAAVVVVGSEGHGAFTGMLLGSVSMHLAHHATCPVVVVRPGWTPVT